MNASIVCLATFLSAAPLPGATERVYTPSPHFMTVIRGQSPQFQPQIEPYEETPTPQPMGPSFTPSPSAPPSPGTVPNGQFLPPACPPSAVPPTFPADGLTPYGAPAPYSQDPFLPGSPGVAAPFGAPAWPGSAFGRNGPRPYRLNQWTSRYDLGVLPQESVNGPFQDGPLGGDEGEQGHLGIFEFDGEWEYSTPVASGLIYSFAPQFGLRTWEGPEGTPVAPQVAFPGSVFRFGLDFELATPAQVPLGFQVGFNPSLNSDFERDATSDAWNWDGRAILIHRVDPFVTIVGGVEYWDRVHDRFIPHAGVIWLPDDRWELRLVFPEPRISYLVGPMWGYMHWLYVRGEYHVEAYQIELERTRHREKVQIEDWRLLVGVRKENYFYSIFLEAGWVFGRDVEFLHGTPGFDVSTGFIARTGIRY